MKRLLVLLSLLITHNSVAYGGVWTDRLARLISKLTQIEMWGYEDHSLQLASDDGVTFKLRYIYPHDDGESKHPLVLFINPWSQSSDIYLMTGIPVRLLKKGFMVGFLTLRGYPESGGDANLGGAKDQADVSKAIDWFIDNTKVDPENIGITGISNGASLALLSMAHDKRIKTTVAMDAWVDLLGSLYKDNTLDIGAANVLVALGKANEIRFDEYLKIFNQMKQSDFDISTLYEWNKERSVVDNVDKLNHPILFLHNYSDFLFEVNQTIELFDKLTCQKSISLYPGNHGTSVFFEPLHSRGKTSEILNWFEYWLMDNKDLNVHLNETKYASRNSTESWRPFGKYESTYTNSSEEENLPLKRYYLYSGLLIEEINGDIEEYPLLQASSEDTFIHPNKDLIHTLESLLTMANYNLNKVDKQSGIAFTSDILQKHTILGKSKLNFWIQADHPKIKLSAYLFSKSRSKYGKYISRANTIIREFTDGYANVDLELSATSYQFKPGDRLVLVIYSKAADYYVPEGEEGDFKIVISPDKPAYLDVKYYP